MTKTEAEAIAQVECEKRGWPWLAPIKSYWGIFSYTIRTNTNSRGGNATIVVRKRDRTVVKANFVSY